MMHEEFPVEDTQYGRAEVIKPGDKVLVHTEMGWRVNTVAGIDKHLPFVLFKDSQDGAMRHQVYQFSMERYQALVRSGQPIIGKLP